jgi:predicted signal transduction protein with EAL and GGDEF domain
MGLDAFDTMVHVVVSGTLVVLIAATTRNPEPTFVAGCAALVILGVRRRFALTAMQKAGEISGETSGAYRLADVEGRLAELETLHARVAELEERVDFSERLLATKDEAQRLEAPK